MQAVRFSANRDHKSACAGFQLISICCRESEGWADFNEVDGFLEFIIGKLGCCTMKVLT
mgnify:CR=1 FL=1